MSDWGGERLREDPRWKFGIPSAGNANYAWVQHFIHHLAPTGGCNLTSSFPLGTATMIFDIFVIYTSVRIFFWSKRGFCIEKKLDFSVLAVFRRKPFRYDRVGRHITFSDPGQKVFNQVLLHTKNNLIVFYQFAQHAFGGHRTAFTRRMDYQPGGHFIGLKFKRTVKIKGYNADFIVNIV